ncbi:MAG TPA: HD domain-containing protein [archaeon]|nr:HD domain-containing protein [archaeon]
MSEANKTSYRHPDFLTQNDHPIHRIRCPIHGFIHFSENEKKIIDHPVFRRLRFIKQLALTNYVYPGATHTRFDHSLGVMEIATRSYDMLIAKRGDLLENTFKKVDGLEKKPLAFARQILRLAALLHDIGHASFCHAAEEVVFKHGTHEDFTEKLLKEGELGSKIDKIFGDGFAVRVAQLIKGFPDLPPQLKILNDLISGEMDADRTDFLIRDSHYCGVEYGLFDYRRMIECLEIYENSEQELEIALNNDGLHTFEALILARYQMYTQVYYHRIRIIYDYYLKKYYESLGDECPNNSDKIIANNDITMMNKIIEDAKNNNGNLSVWAKRIFCRDHHKVVFDTGFNADNKDSINSSRLLKNYQEKYPNYEFILIPASASIHKQYTPGDMDEINILELMVVYKTGEKAQPISKKSNIIGKIPKRFLCLRIFSDAKDKTLREEMRNYGIQKWNEF